MAIKVDLKKAYDSVSWNFLHQSMKLYGFTERWYDLLIVVKADIFTAKSIDRVFQKFHEVSGLAMNKEKSAVIFSKSARSKRRLLQVLQVKVESFLIKYLGIPLVNIGLRSVDCKEIFDKATARLEHWNIIILSLAGRIELLRSVLYSFLLDANKMSQLKWSQVTLLYAEGGFNLCRIIDVDFAAKAVICWDFVKN
ncbi:uncharacterized protein LOC132269188 [Cornus florida]|uniref:uncharacterized protein LOC132269188 n=1 Tax=Cornus florida TaxID=4283 RepID=UPI002898D39C|nr:uncharacterized protein LOC132269188 [Cornus florida]